MADFDLVVREPFGEFQRGEEILASDPRADAVLADLHQMQFVTRRAPLWFPASVLPAVKEG